MNELYTKYDSSFRVLDNNGVKFVSKEYADEMYRKAEKAFEESKQAAQEEFEKTFSESNQSSSNINPKGVMPIGYSKSETFKISGKTVPLSYAGFRIDCWGTVNAQYDTFMDLSCSGVYQNGAAGNYDGFRISNEKREFQNNRTVYRISFAIDVAFSWTEPSTGMKHSETIREYKSIPFLAS